MAMFTRVIDVISANVNALLERAEDPERLLRKLLRDMEDGLAAAREQAASAIAAERRLLRALEQHRHEAARWQHRATLALAAEREDLARQALVCKLRHDDIVLAMETQYAEAQRMSADLKSALAALQSRIVELRQRQHLLFARRQAARVRWDVQRALGSAALGITDPLTTVERLEGQLTDMEDELLARIELSQTGNEPHAEIADLELSSRVDAELAGLKRSHTSSM